MVVFAPEVHSFFFKPFLDYFREKVGDEKLNSILREFGISQAELLDKSAWLSLEFCELFLQRFILPLDANALEQCARRSTSPEYIGFLRPLFRAIGNPMFAYTQVAAGTARFNKIGKFQLEKLGSTHIRLTYISLPNAPRESTDIFCQGRIAQISALTTMFDLPPAIVTHSQCMQKGGNACIYEVQWTSKLNSLLRWIIPVLSGAITGILSIIFEIDLLTTIISIAIVLAFTWFMIRYLELKSELSERAKDLLEQKDALTFVTKANEQRFEELLEAKKATESIVEERTRELAIANTQLKSLDELKSQFIANISHELRTPLTLSLGPLETLLQREHPPQTRDYLDTIYRNQLRLTKLISDLLDFTKLEAGKVELQFTRENVKHIVQELANTLKAATEHRHIRFEVELPEYPVWLYIDQDKFEKITMNLLSNAFKFTPDGGVIKIQLQAQENQVVLTVQDTGPGIPQEKISTIFDRFSQVDASQKRHYGGTGLGLAMVREYTEMHGGHVQVESQLGAGSTFSVRFLQGKEHLDPERVSEDASSISGVHRSQLVEFESSLSNTNQSPPSLAQEFILGTQQNEQVRSLFTSFHQNTRILIVDDSADMRAYLHSLLREQYSHIDLASDGMEAFLLAKERPPDLIISDVMMPKMSGDELCKTIKNDPTPLGRTPIILLTARAEMTSKLEGLGVGANDYLVKPFNAAELRLRVRNLLHEHYQERAISFLHEQVTERQKDLEADLSMAAQFQQSLLAYHPPPPMFRVATRYHPMEQVGGDIYSIDSFYPNHVRVLLADVRGHGVEAASRTGIILAHYGLLSTPTTTPGEVLTLLSQAIVQRYEKEIRCAACCLDIYVHPDGRATLVYAQSSEVSLWIGVQGSFRPLDVSWMGVVGYSKDYEYETLEVPLEAGARVIALTDGIREQINEERQCFEASDAWHPTWEHACKQPTIELALTSLVEAYDRFRGHERPTDDMTLVGVELVEHPRENN